MGNFVECPMENCICKFLAECVNKLLAIGSQWGIFTSELSLCIKYSMLNAFWSS